jgi:hypothetical protein
MQACGEVEVLLYTFIAFVPDGIVRCENLKSCSAAAVNASATTTTTINTNTNTITTNITIITTTITITITITININTGLVLKTSRRVGKLVAQLSPYHFTCQDSLTLYCRKCLQALIAKMQSPIKDIILDSDEIIYMSPLGLFFEK